MQVAVTGSSGYLGQLVLRKLDADPRVERILGLDIVGSTFQSPKLSHQFADVRTADFGRAFAGCDVVYHLAFIVEPPKQKSMDMDTIEAINVGGSRRVFEAAARAGVTKIVYASSIAAYGSHADNPVPLSETAPRRPNPDWYYSRTKGRVEEMLDQLERAHPDLVVIRFRPCIFVGPSAKNAMTAMFSAKVMPLMGGDMLTDLCWDDDVGDAFRLALDYDQSDSFNLSGDNPRTLREYGRLLHKTILPIPRSLFQGLARVLTRVGLVSQAELEWVLVGMRAPIIVSNARARERLGWQPQHDAVGTLMAFAKSQGITTGTPP